MLIVTNLYSFLENVFLQLSSVIFLYHITLCFHLHILHFFTANRLLDVLLSKFVCVCTFQVVFSFNGFCISD